MQRLFLLLILILSNSVHAKVGEFDIRDVPPLNKAQLTALHELVESEPAATVLAHEVEADVRALGSGSNYA